MNENCVFFHGGEVGKLVFLDAGPGLITGLKQVLAKYIQYFVASQCE